MFFSLALLFTFPHVGICVPHTFKSLSGLSIALGIEWLSYSCAVGINVAVGHQMMWFAIFIISPQIPLSVPQKIQYMNPWKSLLFNFHFSWGQTWIRTIVQLTPGLTAWALLQGHEHWCQLKGCGFLFHNQDCFFWERGNNNEATENKSGASPLSIALTFCSSRRKKGLEKWKRCFLGVSTEEIHCRGGGIIKQDFQMKVFGQVRDAEDTNSRWAGAKNYQNPSSASVRKNRAYSCVSGVVNIALKMEITSPFVLLLNIIP